MFERETDADAEGIRTDDATHAKHGFNEHGHGDILIVTCDEADNMYN